MSGDLIPQQQTAVERRANAVDLAGNTRPSRSAVRRVRREVEEALVSAAKIERAKHIAIAGMLAENQLKQLADALSIDDAASRMAADDYIRALHAAGIAQVLKAGN